jgi:hypothetical protein
MAQGKALLLHFEIVGEGSCVGGTHPDPPLDFWPKLAWQPKHPVHGAKVITEDGRASVEEIATAACETPSYDALADRFGTTPDHIAQAVDYAVSAGFLSHQ